MRRLVSQVTSQLWWDNYCKRNMSIVTDLFAGQLRSIVECKHCGYKSRAFDPFWDLSVRACMWHRVCMRRVPHTIPRCWFAGVLVCCCAAVVYRCPSLRAAKSRSAGLGWR